MELVDEEDDLSLGARDLFEEGLQAVLEFAAILRAGDHGAEVHGDDALVLEGFGHVAVDDAAGEAFDDGGLADAGFADEHGVVLRAAGEHLHDAADLVVAADDGIDLPLAGKGGEVFAVFLQGLELVLGILVGDALVAADFRKRFEHGVAFETELLEDFLKRGTALGHQAEEQVFGADEVVFELLGIVLGGIEGVLQFVAEVDVRGTRALDAWAAVEFLVEGRLDLGGLGSKASENLRDDAFLLRGEGGEEVLAVDLLVGKLLRHLLRLLHGFLGFCGETL